jgi:nicotinamidase-related amidase
VIEPKKIAMIVVDMQNDFVAPGAAMETPAARQVVPQDSRGGCAAMPGSKSSTRRMCIAATGATWDCFDDLHPPIAVKLLLEGNGNAD